MSGHSETFVGVVNSRDKDDGVCASCGQQWPCEVARLEASHSVEAVPGLAGEVEAVIGRMGGYAGARQYDADMNIGAPVNVNALTAAVIRGWRDALSAALSRSTPEPETTVSVRCGNCGADLGYPFSSAGPGHVCPVEPTP